MNTYNGLNFLFIQMVITNGYLNRLHFPMNHLLPPFIFKATKLLHNIKDPSELDEISRMQGRF